MSNVVGREVREGIPVLIYDSGLERREDTGRIIKAADHTLIKPETAADYHRARKEKKRAAVLAAANAVLERDDLSATHGDLAFVAAISEAVMRKALNSKDPKQVEAARFLLSESGIADDSQDSEGSVTREGQAPRVLVLLAQLVKSRDSVEVIDAVSDDIGTL